MHSLKLLMKSNIMRVKEVQSDSFITAHIKSTFVIKDTQKIRTELLYIQLISKDTIIVTSPASNSPRHTRFFSSGGSQTVLFTPIISPMMSTLNSKPISFPYKNKSIVIFIHRIPKILEVCHLRSTYTW